MTFASPYKNEAYARRKKLIASAKVATGCVDCGLWGPDELLSFDHVTGDKCFNIGQQWDVSLERLQAEIAKCEVVCHNCHAARTCRRLREQSGPVFQPYPKTPRLFRDVVLTEKIDGTNATIWIDGDGEVWAGSKNRWLTPEQDNFGFAAWVSEHASALVDTLGEGVHRGEWWGSGIQRGYGLPKGEKRFSLFNVGRWADVDLSAVPGLGTVPLLYEGPFSQTVVDMHVGMLKERGSAASPGAKAEGVIVFHTQSRQVYKVLCENDELPKTLAAA